MPLTDNDIRLIEGYLDDDLSPAEKEVFVSRTDDPEFVRELTLHGQVSKAVHEVFTSQLRTELKTELRRLDLGTEDNAIQRVNSRYFYWVAAAVVLCLTLVYVLRPAEKSLEELFTQYYQPFPASINVRGESRKDSPAITAYNNGDYTHAAELITAEIDITTDTELKQIFKLLLGNCRLNTNEAPAAEKIFAQVLEEGESPSYVHAEWYLALAYLKQGKSDKALQVLDILAKNNTIYRSRAEDLQRDITSSFDL